MKHSLDRRVERVTMGEGLELKQAEQRGPPKEARPASGFEWKEKPSQEHILGS